MNNRSHPRIPYGTKFRIRKKNPMQAVGLDLSAEGIGFFAPEALDVGDPVDMVFQNGAFLVEGRVCHCCRDASEPSHEDLPYRVGVAFTMDTRFTMPMLMQLNPDRP